MKVVLTSDVKNIGQKGDEKEVKPGFARNYLLPRGLAVLADSAEATKILSEAKKKNEEKIKNAEKAQINLSKITEKVFTLKRKASKNGKLYGGISKKEILEVIEQKTGVKIEEIFGDFPIKNLGEHQLQIDSPGGENLELKIVVEADAG